MAIVYSVRLQIVYYRTGTLRLFIGPIFSREAVVAPRRPRHFIVRTVYGISLLVLICTAWLLLTNTQDIQNAGDMARFGSIIPDPRAAAAGPADVSRRDSGSQ